MRFFDTCEKKSIMIIATTTIAFPFFFSFYMLGKGESVSFIFYARAWLSNIACFSLGILMNKAMMRDQEDPIELPRP